MSDTKCTYDSGSMYGCYPLCDQPATHVVVYHNGSYPSSGEAVCQDHVKPMEGRAYPGHEETRKIGE